MDETIRKRQRRKDERPGEIMSAALQEFALNGFAGAKLTQVARRAGISHGTIYNYFDTKEALFRALFRAHFVEPLGDEQMVDAFGDAPFADILRAILRVAFRQAAHSEAVVLMRILLLEWQRFPDLAEECYRELFGKAEAMLRQLIDYGIARGELAPSRIDDSPLVLLAPGINAALFGPLSGLPDWEERAEIAIDAFAESFVRGLRKP
jgi:AcrR family transcriptional regulator